MLTTFFQKCVSFILSDNQLLTIFFAGFTILVLRNMVDLKRAIYAINGWPQKSFSVIFRILQIILSLLSLIGFVAWFLPLIVNRKGLIWVGTWLFLIVFVVMLATYFVEIKKLWNSKN